MIGLLSKIFIKNAENHSDPAVRKAYGMLCSVVGIFLNFLLFAGKMVAGWLSHSVAITADAFNNLSDAGSSVITLLGFQLSGRKPDAEHPFGHGRVEYLSGLLVSLLILLMGVELGKSSVEKLLHPEPLQASWLAVGILAVSILVKVYMFFYNRSVGKKIQSTAMEATALDSLSDCLSTGAVMIATVLNILLDWQLDAWFGLLVSGLILYSGYCAARDTLGPLLGQPPEEEFVHRIRSIVMSFSPIRGIHDLVVHDYGPGRCMVTLHAEVPADGDIMAMHDVIDNAEQELRQELNCEAVIHMDPIIQDGGRTREMQEKVQQALQEAISADLTIHDFRMVPGPTHTNLIFDAVVPYGSNLTDSQAQMRISQVLHELDPQYNAVVKVDRSYTNHN